MSDIHVTGLADLQKMLDTLPAKIEKNIMRGALRAGMNVVKPAAQEGIHSISGELARSLKVGTRAKGGTVYAALKATGATAFIARFLEYGVSAHFISVPEVERIINAKRSIRLGRIVRESMSTINRHNSLVIGRTFVGPTVHHPGFRPKKFLRPALDQQARAAVEATGEYIKARLESKHGLDTGHIMIEGDE